MAAKIFKRPIFLHVTETDWRCANSVWQELYRRWGTGQALPDAYCPIKHAIARHLRVPLTNVQVAMDYVTVKDEVSHVPGNEGERVRVYRMTPKAQALARLFDRARQKSLDEPVSLWFERQID